MRLGRLMDVRIAGFEAVEMELHSLLVSLVGFGVER
jgi:hypothetical protein